MYHTKDVIRALEILGFNIREPDAGNMAYCMHKISKEEVWLTTAEPKQAEDVLEYLFKPVMLPMKYFKGVYMSLKPEKVYPSDQL